MIGSALLFLVNDTRAVQSTALLLGSRSTPSFIPLLSLSFSWSLTLSSYLLPISFSFHQTATQRLAPLKLSNWNLTWLDAALALCTGNLAIVFARCLLQRSSSSYDEQTQARSQESHHPSVCFPRPSSQLVYAVLSFALCFLIFR